MSERMAEIRGRDVTTEKVAAYLPSNYRVTDADPIDSEVVVVFIRGHDVAGWTLDGYVLPRLASGLMFGKEVTP